MTERREGEIPEWAKGKKYETTELSSFAERDRCQIDMLRMRLHRMVDDLTTSFSHELAKETGTLRLNIKIVDHYAALALQEFRRAPCSTGSSLAEALRRVLAFHEPDSVLDQKNDIRLACDAEESWSRAEDALAAYDASRAQEEKATNEEEE